MVEFEIRRKEAEVALPLNGRFNLHHSSFAIRCMPNKPGNRQFGFLVAKQELKKHSLSQQPVDRDRLGVDLRVVSKCPRAESCTVSTSTFIFTSTEAHVLRKVRKPKARGGGRLRLPRCICPATEPNRIPGRRRSRCRCQSPCPIQAPRQTTADTEPQHVQEHSPEQEELLREGKLSPICWRRPARELGIGKER